MYYLYDNTKKIIKEYNYNDVIDKLYLLEARIPEEAEMKESKYFKNKNPKEIREELNKLKLEISKIDNKIPLYDVYTDNLYVIDKHNVYYRVVHQNYRFPDQQIINYIKEKNEKMSKKIITNDVLLERKRRKYHLMLEFLDSFNLDELYNTYIRVFYLYANEVGKNITFCVRKSFLPHFYHIKPYYLRSEILNLASNIGIKLKDKYYDEADIQDMCKVIRENDISAKILLDHQKYMINENKVGLIQYYSLHGSYYINQYLRGLVKYSHKNDYLEKLIYPMWKLVANAPAFDNDYVLYRFISDDSFLKNIEIGDVYMDKGFMSTTRDPFYRADQYQFGFILLKIKIPKNTIGVGLCIETLSHFPYEEEIILPPLSMLKLEKRDNKCEYSHTDDKITSKIKTRYEFKYIGKKEISFEKRPPSTKALIEVDFLNLQKIETYSLSEKIKMFVKLYVNDMGQFNTVIGDNTYTVLCEYFDSTGAYKKFYGLTTSNGFSMYSIYNNHVLFFIELGEDGGEKIMHVNYYVKYSVVDRASIISDDNFIYFISSVAYYFEIDRVIIYAEYATCDFIDDKKAVELRNIENKQRSYSNSQIMDLRQRNFSVKNDEPIKTTQAKTKTIKPTKELEDDLTDQLILYGGTYCIDFYNYFVDGAKKYQKSKILAIELGPVFTYHDLDKLKEIKAEILLRKDDRDELYQIYHKIYKYETKNDTFADFYIWIAKNKCYLMDILVGKTHRIFSKENPFIKAYYILDPATYLYNRGYIKEYPKYIVTNNINVQREIRIPTNTDIRSTKFSR